MNAKDIGRPKKDSTVRDKIVGVAARLFYNQGYNTTGINQVIDEAGIARASLYHHFKSKTDLLHTYLEQQHDKWFKALDDFINTRKSPKERLLAIFDYRMQRQITLEFGGCPFVKANTETTADDKTTNEIVNRNKDRLKAMISSLVKQLPSKSTSLSASMLTETLFLLMEGATTVASFQKTKEAHANARSIANRLLAQH
jgi:AcrR family transcriptional regulator